MTIIVSKITKRIRGQCVLDDVSIRVDSGSIVGLSGINGSGKTMLMRAIAGLVKLDAGSIEVDGKVLWEESEFPNSIGILIENPEFLDSYTGFENLKMLSSIKGIASNDQVRQSIQEVGLDPFEKKKYKKYSLGMKQRLGIAAALMEKPDIILLDEPMNALDEVGISLVKGLILREKARGASIVLSCHDKTVLAELSDETYVMSDGRIVKHHVPKGPTSDE